MQLSSTISLSIKPVSARTVWNTGVVLLVLLVPLILPTIADPDLWGHLRFGLDTLNSRSIVQVDPYSYLTAGQRWINHEWLSEVFFALAYSAAGTVGLGLLRLLICTALLAINYRYLCAHGATVMQGAVFLLLTFFSFYLGIGFVRPQLFTYLFLLLVLLALVAAEHGQLRWLWTLPPLFMLWANFHGGFLAGLGILLVWAVLHLFQNRSHLWPVLPVALLSVLGTLINPYGLDLLIFLLRTATVPRPDITEWQPIRIVSLQGVAYSMVLLVPIATLLDSHRARSIPLVGLFCILALAPLVASRHLPLFALAAPILVGEHVAQAWAKLFARIQSKSYSPLMAMLPLLTAIGLGVAASGNVGMIRLDKRAVIYPAAAVAQIKASGFAGNLVTPFNWGEYIIWHLGPQVQVSMDGRRETVYPDDIYRANLDFEFGTGNWDAVLTSHPADMALVDKHEVAYNLMRLKPGWVSVYEDDAAAIFVPQGSPLIEKFRQIPRSTLPPDGDGLNFP